VARHLNFNVLLMYIKYRVSLNWTCS